MSKLYLKVTVRYEINSLKQNIMGIVSIFARDFKLVSCCYICQCCGYNILKYKFTLSLKFKFM